MICYDYGQIKHLSRRYREALIFFEKFSQNANRASHPALF